MNEKLIEAAVQSLQNKIHSGNVAAGWWTNIETGEPIHRGFDHFLAKLCLVHSEVSEACEGFRKGLLDDHLPTREMAEVELADAVIRIFDLAGGYNYDLAGAITEKLEYNAQRADHRIENRLKKGGKKT